jgi:hypothetical protein
MRFTVIAPRTFHELGSYLGGPQATTQDQIAEHGKRLGNEALRAYLTIHDRS